MIAATINMNHKEYNMAFDGITVRSIIHELNQKIIGTRIYKIAQPEKDELLLTLKGSTTSRLLISVNPSLPLLYLTEDNKQSPDTAPAFCMLLRKHLGNGRIVSISQPALERVIDITIEHLDDFGEICKKHLNIELMGKYSNIIFTDDNQVILDSIKRVPASMSSIREVLPNKPYFIPNTVDKLNPLTTSYEEFKTHVFSKTIPVGKAIQMTYIGFSNIISEEIIYRCGINSDTIATECDEDTKLHIFNIFSMLLDDIKSDNYAPAIYYNGDKPTEFSPLALNLLSDNTKKDYDSISEVLYSFYNERNNKQRLNQKGIDLKHLVSSLISRDQKKNDMWEKQLSSCKDSDRFRIYGELINTYGYEVPQGSKSFKAYNYYTNEEIDIPLDPILSPKDNAIRYFNRYQKLKRTKEAIEKLMAENNDELKYLESVDNALDIAKDIDDLGTIREELTQMGLVKKKDKKGKKITLKSKPLHFISSDGFHIYVGKNNFQNEDLSFKLADNSDYWFHTKDFAGSHVIVKTEGKELPDRTYEEAAALAAYYSKGSDQDKVEVDYTLKKNLKKPPQQKPGFVIYHQNYSMTIKPSNKLEQVE